MEFQSLVGTLKTRKINGTRSMNLPVSIPCRYAKNASGAVHIHGQNLVSIPCRYAKNEDYRQKVEDVNRVSIPCRYAKNERSHVRSNRRCVPFQSLVGTLKTSIGGSYQ